MTTPSGYSEPISGSGQIAYFDVISHGGGTLTVTTIEFEREWLSLAQARAYNKNLVKFNAEVSDAVRDTVAAPNFDGFNPVEEWINLPGIGLEEINQCLLSPAGIQCMQDLSSCTDNVWNTIGHEYSVCSANRNNARDLATLTRDLCLQAASMHNGLAIGGAGFFGTVGGVCGGLTLNPIGVGIGMGIGGAGGYIVFGTIGKAQQKTICRNNFEIAWTTANQNFSACMYNASNQEVLMLQACRQDFFNCMSNSCQTP